MITQCTCVIFSFSLVYTCPYVFPFLNSKFPCHCLQLEGPCVLQVQKVRNISASKDHEESQGAPRMLRLQMTDGHTTCVGLEFKHLSKLR